MADPMSPNSLLQAEKAENRRLRDNNMTLMMEYDRLEELNSELQQSLSSSRATTAAMRREHVLLRDDINRLRRVEAGYRNLMRLYDELIEDTARLREELAASQHVAHEAIDQAEVFQRERENLVTERNQLANQMDEIRQTLADEQRVHGATRNLLMRMQQRFDEVNADWQRRYERFQSECLDYLAQIDRRLQRTEQLAVLRNRKSDLPALTLDVQLRDAALRERMQNGVYKHLHNIIMSAPIAAIACGPSRSNGRRASWLASGAALVLNIAVSILFGFVAFTRTVRNLFAWKSYHK